MRTMRSRHKAYIVSGLIVLLSITSSAFAQEDIFFLGNPMGVGIRALTMGGAYVAVADNNSAAYWNPAGLGQLRRMEMNVDFSHNRVGSLATFLGNQDKSNQSFTRLNSLGFSYPIPTYQGSLVFAVAYNKVRDYDDVIEIHGYNPYYSPFPDFFNEVGEHENITTTVDKSLEQYEFLTHQGSLNNFTLSGAIEIAPKLFTGLSINFISGGDERALEFREADLYDVYNIPFKPGDTVVSDLKRWKYFEDLSYKISATSYKLGALYCASDMLRLGATVTPPLRYKIKWNWSDHWTITYDDDYTEEVPKLSSDGDFIIEQPFVFEGGASIKLLNILLAGSVEFQDWTQARIKTELPQTLYSENKDDVNARIKSDLKSTTKIRLGAEFYVPIIKARLDAGYFYNPSAYADEAVNSDHQTFSGGLHFQAGRQAMVTLGLAHTLWKVQSYDLFTNNPDWLDDSDWSKKKITASEDKNITSVYAGLTIRF